MPQLGDHGVCDVSYDCLLYNLHRELNLPVLYDPEHSGCICLTGSSLALVTCARELDRNNQLKLDLANVMAFGFWATADWEIVARIATAQLQEKKSVEALSLLHCIEANEQGGRVGIDMDHLLEQKVCFFSPIVRHL